MNKNRGESFGRKAENEKGVESRELAEKLGEIAIKGVGGEGIASGKDTNKRRGNRARRNLENAGREDKRSIEDKAGAERIESRTAGREEMAGGGSGFVDESEMGNEAETEAERGAEAEEVTRGLIENLEEWRESYDYSYDDIAYDDAREIDNLESMRTLAELTAVPKYAEKVKNALWESLGGGKVYGEIDDPYLRRSEAWDKKELIKQNLDELMEKMLLRAFIHTPVDRGGASEKGMNDDVTEAGTSIENGYDEVNTEGENDGRGSTLLEETKTFWRNLGFEVPIPQRFGVSAVHLFEAVYKKEIRLDFSLNYENRQLVKKSGIYEERPLKTEYGGVIRNVLGWYDEDAQSLSRRLTDSAIEFYEQQSKVLGGDAIELYLKKYEHSKNREVAGEEHELLEFFDEEGRPSELGFQPDAKLIKAALGLNILGDFQGVKRYANLAAIAAEIMEYQDFHSVKRYAKLARLNADKMPEGVAKTLVMAMGEAGFLDGNDKDIENVALMRGMVDFTFKYTGKGDAKFINESGEIEPEFWERMLGSECLDLVQCFEGFEQHYSADQMSFMGMPKEARQVVLDAIGLQAKYNISAISQENLDILKVEIGKNFDAEGAKPEFYEFLFAQGKLGMLLDLEKAGAERMQLDAAKQHALEIYANMSEDKKEIFASGLAKTEIEDLSNEQIDNLAELITRAAKSNAIEIRRAQGEILVEVAKSNNPIEMFDRIEQIFLRNDLPNAGKVFKMFQTIYPDFEGLGGAEKRGVLGELPDEGMISKESVLFTDVLKAEIGSNNRLMRKYVQDLEQGEQKAEALINGEMNYEEMSTQEREMMEAFLRQLTSTYNLTKQGKEKPFEPSGNMVDDLAALRQMFGVSERHGLADRIVRSFGYLLNIRSVEELK